MLIHPSAYIKKMMLPGQLSEIFSMHTPETTLIIQNTTLSDSKFPVFSHRFAKEDGVVLRTKPCRPFIDVSHISLFQVYAQTSQGAARRGDFEKIK